MSAAALFMALTCMAQTSHSSATRAEYTKLTLSVHSTNTTDIIRQTESSGNEEPGMVYLQSFEKDCDWKVTDAANKMFIGTISQVSPIDEESYLVSGYDQKKSRDGWAISPAVNLEKGKTYHVSLWCYAPGFDGVKEEFEITAGRSQSAESQQVTLIDRKGDKAQAISKWEKLQGTFTPEESGEYHFGIHHCTKELYVNTTGFDRFYVGTAEDTYVYEEPKVLPEPKGEQIDYMTYFDDIYYGYTVKGGKIVYGEKDSVFIQGIAAQKPKAWVYGIKKGNTVEIPCGQYMGVHSSMFTGDANIYLFAGTDYVPGTDDPRNFTYTPAKSLILHIEGNTLKTDKDVVIVQASSKKGTPFNGSLNFEMSPFNEKAIKPSANAERALYQMSYTSSKNGGKETSCMVNVAFAEDTVFIQKASYYMQYMEDAWMYGISDGKTITFPSKQYIGNYEGDGPFPVYLYGATISGKDDEGEDTYELTDSYTMSIDGDTFSSPDYYVMHLGGIVSEGCHGLTLKKFDMKSAIPADINDVSMQTVPGTSFIIKYTPEDVDGNYMLEDSIFLRMYLDDKLYTFKPKDQGGKYKNLKEEITEIPAGFSDSYDFFGSLTMHKFQIYVYEEFEKASFELVYHTKESTGVSARAVYVKGEGFKGSEGKGEIVTGISTTETSGSLVRTDTYNAYGQKIKADEKGIVIIVETFDNGSRKTYKKLNR